MAVALCPVAQTPVDELFVNGPCERLFNAEQHFYVYCCERGPWCIRFVSGGCTESNHVLQRKQGVNRWKKGCDQVVYVMVEESDSCGNKTPVTDAAIDAELFATASLKNCSPVSVATATSRMVPNCPGKYEVTIPFSAETRPGSQYTLVVNAQDDLLSPSRKVCVDITAKVDGYNLSGGFGCCG